MKVRYLRLILFTCSISTLTGLSAMAEAQDSVAACEALSHVDFLGIDEAPTQIASAEVVDPKNSNNDSFGRSPVYCSVSGYVWPQVGFELRLPITGWNGKFIEIGCGGACGHLGWTFWCPVHRGYACIVADMGHRGVDQDGLWAANNLQAQIDFGFRGVHVAAVAGKAITEYYYRRPPQYSFYHGCSTGARLGLIEAERFPWDFDGVMAGGVWVDDTISSMNFAWGGHVLRDANGKPILSHAELEMAHEAVLAKCDMDDGVKDGLIGNPLGCKFDPGELRCKAGQQSRCLTDAQVEAVTKMYNGPMNSKGELLSPGGFARGTEPEWMVDPGDQQNGENPIVSDGSMSHVEEWATEYFRWMVLPPAGRKWNLKDFDFDRDYKRFANGAQESLIGDTNPDLRKFKKAGGKLLMYVGWKDGNLPITTIDYYQTVERTMGGPQSTRDFARLFLVPGMEHCTGGEGAFAVDYLDYMEKWVEKDQAPDVMIGAHVPKYEKGAEGFQLQFPLNPSLPITFTRPIYPYPQWAKYKGSGDTNKAENFEPVEAQ